METPQANLTAGMGWFQNAYMRRINTRHRLWGHLFGGRYKAIVVEPGNAYWAIIDYIHLNPVRAGLVAGREAMESYAWSSLPLYLKEPWERLEFLETPMGFQVAGCWDDAEGRKEFLMGLERSVDWGNPMQAGLFFSSEQRRPELSVHAALRRGWFFGSQAFRESLMAKLKIKLEEGGGRRSANGYHGPEIKDHGHAVAESLATAGCGYFVAPWKSYAAARPDRFWLLPPERRASRLSALIKEIGRQKVSSSHGKTKERSINAKLRPKFAPRRVGAKVSTGKVLTEVEVLS